jgi:hypothetical protein
MLKLDQLAAQLREVKDELAQLRSDAPDRSS